MASSPDRPGSSERLSEAERRCLQGHARRALEAVDVDRGAREGECVWHTKRSRGGLGQALWTPDTLNGLEKRGLILVREEWKDNFVRLTDEALALLRSA
jgi:hypothetical protein